MSVFLHVTLEVRASGMSRFVAAMEEIVPLLEGWGWRLDRALRFRTGKLNTVVDIWELPNFDAYDAGLKKFVAHPRFAALKEVLDDTVSAETVIFADSLGYSGHR